MTEFGQALPLGGLRPLNFPELWGGARGKIYFCRAADVLRRILF